MHSSRPDYPCLHLSARVHLHRGASERTDFQLPQVPRNLSRVSDVVPNQVIRANDLDRAMVDLAILRTCEPGQSVFENRDIRAMTRSVLLHGCKIRCQRNTSKWKSPDDNLPCLWQPPLPCGLLCSIPFPQLEFPEELLPAASLGRTIPRR